MNIFILLISLITLENVSCNVFKIPLVRHKSIRHQSYEMNGFNQFGITADWMKPKPKPKPQNDSVALYRYLDSEFYGVVRIGYKAQVFNMVFDTAWGDSWVISEQCSSYNIACLVHNKYDHSKSSRYKENGKPFFKNLGSYNISGFLSTDDFNIGHSNISQHTFAEIVDVPNYLAFEKADGVIGLGYKSLTSGQNPLFYDMLQQGLIKQPIFSIYLNRDKSSNDGGLITLGGIEERHILKGHNITWVSVNRTGYWQFKIDRIVMDFNKKSYPACLNGCQGVVDTSTTEIVGPYNEILKFNTIIKAKHLAYNKYRVSCDAVKKLPRVEFVINNSSFYINGEDYVQKMYSMGFGICMSAFTPTPKEMNDPNWYIGAAFFHQYYSIFHLADNKIGIVKAA